MNTKRIPWLSGVILLTSLAGLVSIAVEKNDQVPTNFYAYYTKLGMSVKAGGQLVKAESKPRLATKRWYHVAGSRITA